MDLEEEPKPDCANLSKYVPAQAKLAARNNSNI